MPHVFARRRQQLMDAYGPGSILIVPAAREQQRNADVDYAFRQDSDFYYLTGFEEPDAILVLSPGRQGEQVVLFVRPRDRDAETWNGRRAGVEGAVDRFHAEKAYPVSAFEMELTRLVEGTRQVCYTFGRHATLDRMVLQAAQRHRAQPRLGLDGPDYFADPLAVLSDMRLYKQPNEIEALRRAAAITAHGHHEAMRIAAPGAGEWEIQAALEYVFQASGSPRVGYGSIVAAGENATILHYTTNRVRAKDGDLVLIDAGAEVDFLTADVTRVFPVSGRFSPAQRAVYEVVLEAELRAIAACRVGRAAQEVHDIAVRTLTEGMVTLGLLSGNVTDLIASEAFRRYYMHRTSHWLGMDVHDVGWYRQGGVWRNLAPGMVLTIEPGLYIAADDDAAPEALRGIGIRIEDDVLVTDDGPDVLTAQCVKDIADIEAMVASRPRHVSRISA